MTYHIEFDREEDGRWIADIPEIPGVTVYGATQEEAMCKAQALALNVLARKVELGEMVLGTISFEAA